MKFKTCLVPMIALLQAVDLYAGSLNLTGPAIKALLESAHQETAQTSPAIEQSKEVKTENQNRTVPAEPVSLQIDLNAADTSKITDGRLLAGPYLKEKYGIEITNVTEETAVHIVRNAASYGGKILMVPETDNVIMQEPTNGNRAMSQTWKLPSPRTEITFTRPGINPNPTNPEDPNAQPGVSFPKWSVHALDENGNEIAYGGELGAGPDKIFAFVAVPGKSAAAAVSYTTDKKLASLESSDNKGSAYTALISEVLNNEGKREGLLKEFNNRIDEVGTIIQYFDSRNPSKVKDALPALKFTLRAAGAKIAAIRFDADGEKRAAFSAPAIMDIQIK